MAKTDNRSGRSNRNQRGRGGHQDTPRTTDINRQRTNEPESVEGLCVPAGVKLIKVERHEDGRAYAWFSTRCFADARAIWRDNNANETGLAAALVVPTKNRGRFKGTDEEFGYQAGRACVQAHSYGLSESEARRLVTVLNKRATNSMGTTEGGNTRSRFRTRTVMSGAYVHVIDHCKDVAPLFAEVYWTELLAQVGVIDSTRADLLGPEPEEKPAKKRRRPRKKKRGKGQGTQPEPAAETTPVEAEPAASFADDELPPEADAPVEATPAPTPAPVPEVAAAPATQRSGPAKRKETRLGTGLDALAGWKG